MKYRKLAIERADDLLFGIAPHPVTTRQGLKLGGGLVYPELNFTLPPMDVTSATMPQVVRQYHDIITDALRRAAELEVPGVVIEFETVPPMTATPAFGLEIVRVLLAGMEEARSRHGLRSVLRMTPNDNREFARPPVMRSGEHWEKMLELFESSAEAGAELLSIESVGGKELHDDALMQCDLAQVVFSLCVLGVRDMEFLWKNLSKIAARHHAICAGDTACGFGNTAMVLAEQKMIPRTFAAVVRAVTAVRTLVGYEHGAIGPGKDCGYENAYIKAITGCPIAMEGKTAACAHFSPLGNIAAAYADTWSNESVQNVRLLAGPAPTCSMEQLAYDCRLMNQALSEGRASALTLRRWLVNSDAGLDPQAWVLTPESVLAIARSIVGARDHYHAGVAAARCAIDLISTAHKAGQLRLPEREVPLLDRIREQADELPDDEAAFIAEQRERADPTRYLPAEYLIR